MRRRSRIHRPNRGPPYLQRAIAEVLEERQLLSLTIDVRAADGSKSLQLSNIGQVVNLQVWAEITDPQNQPTQDTLHDVAGSFLGTNIGPGPVAGNLSATLVSPFNYLASQNGTVQDLNGDGNLDVGSNNDSSATNFFFARSQFSETSSSGTIVGNTLEFEIGTLTYTVTHLNYGGETDINFRPRGSSGSSAAIWEEDGQAEDNTTGTFTAGASFVVTAPPAKLAFTTQPASTTIGTPIDAPNGVAVAVEDAAGNIITSNADNISLSLSPNNSALTGTITAQASSGIAGFNTLSVSAVGANYTLVATDTSASLSTTSQPFNVYSSSPYSFQNFESMNPSASLTNGFIPQGSPFFDNNGNIFGTTNYGGLSGHGVVYEIAEPGNVYTSLVSFTGTGGADPGADPQAGLISDGDGNLFGTTYSGGTSNDGTVFELSGPSHTFSSILSFTGTSGADLGAMPKASLTSDGNGNLFGTTENGGTSNDGTVFELVGSSHTFSSVFSFTGASGADPGAAPWAGLTSDGNGNLFGTTEGGSSNYGTVFELVGPSLTFSLVFTFAYANGGYPMAGLTSDGNGNLFGTTEGGGANSDGTVFELAGTSHTFSIITSFGGDFGYNGHIGYGPVTALVSDGNGDLFGTTTAGYDEIATPAVFELAGPSHTYSTVYSFNGQTSSSFQVSLASDSNGNLFGTDNNGGSFGYGSVFELPASSRSTLTTLYSFSGGMGAEPPASPLVIDSSGNLLGVTSVGGDYGHGTVFEIAEPSGVFSTLFSFSGNSGPYPGGDPLAGLISDGNGNLFGTTANGGSSGDGTVFELAGPSYTFSSLVSFTGTSGRFVGTNPETSLTPDGNGNLFGTTFSGGASSDGTVFELVGSTHTFSSLFSFTGYLGQYPGNEIYAPLISDGNGNIFGATWQGGASGDGTVFELAGPSHTFSSLVSFTGTSGADPGLDPSADLTVDGYGNVIGTTQSGGTANDGTVFELAGPSFTFTSLFSFTGPNGPYLGTSPVAGLTSDGYGNILGMTQSGGTSNRGSVFELAGSSHAFSSLFSFSSSGAYPGGGPVYGFTSDGNGNLFAITAVYGTTFELAGPSHTFSLLFPLPGSNGPNLGGAASPLTSDGHGNLFGTTRFGGTAGYGSAFQIILSSKLSFAATPSGAPAGQTLPPVQVNVDQTTGNIATADSSIVTLSIQSGPTGATLGGTTSVQAVNGVATFTNLTLSLPGNYTLIATDGSLSSATSPLAVQPPTITWTGAADGLNWNNPGNWSNNLVPTSTTSATIGSGFTVQIPSGVFSVESLTTASPLEIATGATLQLFGPATFTSSLTIDTNATLKVTADPVVLAVNGLTFTDNGTLDLGANDMIIHNGNLSQITSDLGTQIISSSATFSTTLAIELNNDGHGNKLLTTFDTQPVATTDVLVKYTYFGDTDLNGSVTAADYIAIDNGVNQNLTGWNNGDFNYDGVINGDDYTLIDNAFNTQSATPLATVALPPAAPQTQINKAVTKAPAVAIATSQSVSQQTFDLAFRRKSSLANEIFTD